MFQPQKRRRPSEGDESYRLVRMELRPSTYRQGEEEVYYINGPVFHDEREAKEEANRRQRELRDAGKPGQWVADYRQFVGGRWETIEVGYYSARAD